MEGRVLCSSSGIPFFCSSLQRSRARSNHQSAASSSSLVIHSMATENPKSSSTRSIGPRKVKASSVFPLGEPGPRNGKPSATSPPVKLLTRVEQLKLLTKAEKAGLLSAAEKLGLSLSTIEKLGLLSKAEEYSILSTATNPETPGALQTLSLGLLLLGPLCVYLVPEEYPWEIALQTLAVVVCVLGGSAAFAASNFVSNLQKSR